jgi:hypothetical protein
MNKKAHNNDSGPVCQIVLPHVSDVYVSVLLTTVQVI